MMNFPVTRRRQRLALALSVTIWSACCATVLGLSGCGGNGEEGAGTAVLQSYSSRCQLPPGPSTALQLPAPTGDLCIGKTSFRLVDEGRAEKYTHDPRDRRELSVKVWYPVAPTVGGARATYLEPAIAPSVKARVSVPLAAPDVQTNAKSENSPPDGVYPVIIFSPGYGMVVETYSTLMEDLASHGIVVVAIDHPYISGTASLASGELAQALSGPAPGESMTDFLDGAVGTMVADQRYVLDWMHGAGTGILRGHLDLARVGTVGHSIGGAAAVQAARFDERVKAGEDIDGSIYGGTAGVWPKPLLFLLADNHRGDASVDTVLRLATGLGRKVAVQEAGHLDFSDLKWLLTFYLPGISPDRLAAEGLGSTDAAKALGATRRETLSFLRQFVL